MKRLPAPAIFLSRYCALLLCWALLACSGPGRPPADRPDPGSEGWKRLRGTTWLWTEAGCVDRPLDLASRGFGQQLRIRGVSGGLMLLSDSEFAAENCSRTVIRVARPGPDPGLWSYEEQARVSLPPAEACRGTVESSHQGVIRLAGETLEMLFYRSAWCGGFDARFVYRRAEPRPLSELQVIRHWAAHFNRRDAEAVAALFARSGSLVEPFTPTSDGNLQRHDGRTRVRNWYRDTFASIPWLALRLLSATDSAKPGHRVAEWQYMDSGLVRPFQGRNLFIIAGGEIFETEIQVTTEIVPAPATDPL
jgi:hypothetical protein